MWSGDLPDVARRVGRFAALGVLDRLEVVEHWWVEIHRVTLVERVDLSARGDLDLHRHLVSKYLAGAHTTHIRMGKDKLSKRVVEGVAVHAVAHRKYQVGGRAVHGVPRGDHLAPWAQDVIDRARGAFPLRAERVGETEG